MLLGGQDSPKLLGALQALKDIRLVPVATDFTNQISEKRIQAAVEVSPDFDGALTRGEPATVRVYVYEGELKSSFADQRLEQFFRAWRESTVRERLAERGVSETVLKPFQVLRQNVAPPKKVAGNLLGGLLPYMVLLLCLTGATYPALDLTAGEKERGTIETLLCSPVSRTHLVLGKFLVVLLAALASAVLSLASMGVSFAFINQAVGQFGRQGGLELSLSFSAGDVFLVFAMVLPMAVVFAAAQLAVALFAKSYREAQSYVTPLMFVVILPAAMSIVPGLELNARLALVPVLNISLVCKEILSGTYHWQYIALIFLSSCVYASIALVAAVKLFQREEVLFRM
jgi:sodium transport system permease protein